MMLKTTNHPHKEAIYFLAEQARCLIQAGSADADICKSAAEYLINDDEILTNWLAEKTNTKLLSDKLQDYDTEEFEGKTDTLKIALKDLQALVAEEKTPAKERAWLKNATEIIAEFYCEMT